MSTLVPPMSSLCLASVSPVSRQCLASVSPVSRPCLARVSPVSRQCLASVSPVSRQCLASVSPVSRPCLARVSPPSCPCLSYSFFVCSLASCCLKFCFDHIPHSRLWPMAGSGSKLFIFSPTKLWDATCRQTSRRRLTF